MSSEYIKALVATRENDNLDIFRGFMTSMMEQNLQNEITTYLDSIGVEESREKTHNYYLHHSAMSGADFD